MVHRHIRGSKSYLDRFGSIFIDLYVLYRIKSRQGWHG